MRSQTTLRGQKPADTEIPAIKVTTRLVQINVIVHDKKGDPVGDLTKGVVSNRYTDFTSGGQSHLAPLPTALTVILLEGLNTAFTDQH